MQSRSHNDTVSSVRVQSDTIGSDTGRDNMNKVVTTGVNVHLSTVMVDTQDKYDPALAGRQAVQNNTE